MNRAFGRESVPLILLVPTMARDLRTLRVGEDWAQEGNEPPPRARPEKRSVLGRLSSALTTIVPLGKPLRGQGQGPLCTATSTSSKSKAADGTVSGPKAIST